MNFHFSSKSTCQYYFSFLQEYDDRSQDIWDDKKKENLHWSFLFSQLISQWAQWLGNDFVGSFFFFLILHDFILLKRPNVS